jgi:hypothetical protein
MAHMVSPVAAEAKVVRTPEEQAKYDADQRTWYRTRGRQHPIYNPEGIREREPAA